jgi:hypothetical protein
MQTDAMIALAWRIDELADVAQFAARGGHVIAV